MNIEAERSVRRWREQIKKRLVMQRRTRRDTNQARTTSFAEPFTTERRAVINELSWSRK